MIGRGITFKLTSQEGKLNRKLIENQTTAPSEAGGGKHTK